jgi:hypothetical protein
MSFHAETAVKLFVDFTAKVYFLVFMLLAEESLRLVFKICYFIKQGFLFKFLFRAWHELFKGISRIVIIILLILIRCAKESRIVQI